MPWLNAAIFPDIVIKTDLHSLEDGDMFRDLCAECLRCDIKADTFADILKEVFVDKKLLSLQVPDWFNKVLHGNFEARKQLLLELFLKYNGVDAECSDVEYRTFVGQQLTAWNWSEIEAQCGGNIDVLNELKAEKLLLHIHTLLSPSSAVMAEDVNSMVALENIASTLKVAHNLDIGDINIDNFGFQVFVTQMQKKLKDVKTEWLLNWINALLRTEHVPALLDLAEIMINIDVLRALEHTIFSMLASSVEAEALQSILLVSIKQLGEGCVLKPTMSASELAWRLFKQHNDIHVSDQELKQAFKEYFKEQQLHAGNVLQHLAQKQAGSDVLVPTSVVFEAMGVADFVDDNKVHLYSEQCLQSVVHLASKQLLGGADHTFLVEWINWLLANGASAEPKSQVEELSGIIDIDLLNDVLTLKSMLRDVHHRGRRQS